MYNYLKTNYFRRWKALIWVDAATTSSKKKRRFIKAKYFRRTKKRKITKIRSFALSYIYYKEIFCVNTAIKDKFLWFRRRKKKKKKARLKYKFKKHRMRLKHIASMLARRMPFDFSYIFSKKKRRINSKKFLTRSGMLGYNNAKILEWRKTGRRKAAKIRKYQINQTYDSKEDFILR